jgi:hypothetical protein
MVYRTVGQKSVIVISLKSTLVNQPQNSKPKTQNLVSLNLHIFTLSKSEQSALTQFQVSQSRDRNAPIAATGARIVSRFPPRIRLPQRHKSLASVADIGGSSACSSISSRPNAAPVSPIH